MACVTFNNNEARTFSNLIEQRNTFYLFACFRISLSFKLICSLSAAWRQGVSVFETSREDKCTRQKEYYNVEEHK